MLQGISTTGAVPLARVPWNDPARLMKILDAGAYGVICPMINTRAEAEALVRACKYSAARLPELGARCARPSTRAPTTATKRQRRHRRHADDRDGAGDEEPRRHPERARRRRGLRRPVRPLSLALGLQAAPRPDRCAGGRGAAEDRRGVQASRRGRRHPQRTATYALKMIAQGYQFVTLASDCRPHGRRRPPRSRRRPEERRQVGGKLPAY